MAMQPINKFPNKIPLYEKIIKDKQPLFILTEKVDIHALHLIRDNYDDIFEKIFDTDNVYGESHDTAKKQSFTIVNNLFKSKNKDGISLVEYKYSKHSRVRMGRRWGKWCLQGLWRTIRNTVSHQYYHDLDIVNCHPCFISRVCEDIKFDYPMLKNYILHRPSILKSLIGKTVNGHKIKTTDDSKFYMTIIFYGSSIVTDSEYLSEFYNTHQKFLTYFFKNSDPNYAPYINKAKNNKRKDKTQDPRGSALSYYIQDIEDSVLLFIQSRLDSIGIEYGVLTFDGIMPYKESILDSDYTVENLIEYLEKDLHHHFGFEIQLKEKSLSDDVLDLDGYSLRDEVDFTDEGFGIHYFNCIKSDLKYNEKTGDLYLFNADQKLWELSKFPVLLNWIVEYLDPFIKQHPDPEVVEDFMATIRKYHFQNNLVQKVKSIILYKCRDSNFIYSHFDRAKGLFPIANRMIVDLKTGLTGPRLREHYFTKTSERVLSPSRVPKDSAAMAFIMNYFADLLKTPVSNVNYIYNLMDIFAYALTCENNLKKFFNLIGEKDSGKSCLINLMSKIMHPFSCTVQRRVFIEHKNKSVHDSDIMSLMGSRLGVLSETNDNERFNENLLKGITGGDPQEIRMAGDRNTQSINFDSVLAIASNGVCKVSDPALLDRECFFNFSNKFKVDASFPDLLGEYIDDIFSLLVDRCTAFYNNGRNINFVKEVLLFTKDQQSEQDIFKEWLDTVDIEKTGNADDFIDQSELYSKYCMWVRMNYFDLGSTIDSSKRFNSKIRSEFNLNLAQQKKIEGKKCKVYYGIRIADSFETGQSQQNHNSIAF